ncbi:unnamed protein product [Malus baccata var. baccata]
MDVIFPASEALAAIFPQPSGLSLSRLLLSNSVIVSIYASNYLFFQLKIGIGNKGVRMCSGNFHLFVGFVILAPSFYINDLWNKWVACKMN